MQRKKNSFKDTFHELQNIGLRELYEIIASGLINEKIDTSVIEELAASKIPLLNDINSFFLVGHLASIAIKNINFVSKNCKNLTGYEPKEFTNGGIQFFHEIFCQADKKAATEFLKIIAEHQRKCLRSEKYYYTYSSTFRLYHKNGYFKWFHSQWIFFRHNEKGKPLFTTSIVTDIDDIKDDDLSTLAIIKHSADSDKHVTEEYYERLPDGIDLLTDTDKTILKMLSEGRNNKEIAICFGFSEHKIKDFRKKMLKKTWCSNTEELIYFVYRNHLIV